MTPKEKAKELQSLYFMKMNENFDCISWNQSKQCALICVDQILYSLMEYGEDSN